MPMALMKYVMEGPKVQYDAQARNVKTKSQKVNRLK
jgi:hypothetical protein